MSWIFGFYGSTEGLKIISPQPHLYSYENSNLKIYCGGNKEAIFFSKNTSNQNCWMAAEVGLIRRYNN
jgi:hypothetical protein